MAAPLQVESYNRILATLKECFSVDPSFREAVDHLQKLTENSNDFIHRMECDGKVLLATAHSFIELYLSPEEKKKTIGFPTGHSALKCDLQTYAQGACGSGLISTSSRG